MSKGIDQQTEAALKAIDGTFELCQRCRCCDMEWVRCPYCNGDGFVDCGEDSFDDEDDDSFECSECNGHCGWWMCGGLCNDNGEHRKT